MPKISNRPLTLLTRVRIWGDDYEFLKSLFGDSELGLAGAIRKILSEYVSSVKQRTAQNFDLQSNKTATPLTPEEQEKLDKYLTNNPSHRQTTLHRDPRKL